MDDTLSGAFKTLVSSIQEATLATGDAGLTGALKSTVTTLTGTVRILTDTARVETEVTGASIALSDAVLGITTAYVAFKVATLSAKAAQAALNSTLAINPFAATAIAGGLFLAVINDIAEGIEEAGRRLERFSKIQDDVRRGVVNNATAMQRAFFDFQNAVELGDAVGQARALSAELRTLEDELFRLSQVETGQVTQFFNFRDVAKLLPRENLEKLADQLSIDLETAIRQGGRNVPREAFEEALKDAISTLRERTAVKVDVQVEVDEAALQQAADEAAELLRQMQESAAKAGEDIGQLFENLAFERSLIGKSADEMERLRAARDLESLAVTAQSSDTAGLVMRLNEELTALQSAQAAEQARARAKADLAAKEESGRNSLLETIDAIKQENDLIFLNAEQRRRAIVMREAEKDAVALSAKERKALLDLLNEELDRRDELNKKLEEDTKKTNMLALQTSDILRDGIGNAIADYEHLGDVAKNVFEQIRQAAIRAAVAAAFGPQGTFFGGGGPTAEGAAKGLAWGSSGALLPGLAQGGVISEPSLISTRQGLRPVAEGGRPEAVMPLARGPGGRLGIEASGGGGSQTIVMNISGVTDADSFRLNERQILARAQRGLNRRGV